MARALSLKQVRLYLDMMSQPCRAVYIVSRMLGAPVVEVPTYIGRGATRSAEFLAVNPRGTVPVADFEFNEPGTAPLRCAESTTIMRVLCDAMRSAPAAESLYPTDLTARARVDEMLDWYHASLRQGARNWAFQGGIASLMGLKPDTALLDYGRKLTHKSVKQMQQVLDRSTFLAGQHLTLADIIVACELEQLRVLYPDEKVHACRQLLEADYPGVVAWRARVSSGIGADLWKAANAVLDRAVAKRQSLQSPSAAAEPKPRL